MSDIISILKLYFILYFIPLIICVSLITILLTLVIVKNKKIIKWYLMLKSSSNTQMGYSIENMFEKNKFNKLIDNWTNYNIALTSLWYQSVILIGGFLFSFCSLLITLYWNNGILISIILFIAEIIIVIALLKKRISLFFKINEDLGFKTKLMLEFLLIFIATIPFWIVSFYIIFNTPVMNFNTFISIYLILTLGMYEYTKQIISFFFPIPANGIYSTDELLSKICV